VRNPRTKVRRATNTGDRGGSTAWYTQVFVFTFSLQALVHALHGNQSCTSQAATPYTIQQASLVSRTTHSGCRDATLAVAATPVHTHVSHAHETKEAAAQPGTCSWLYFYQARPTLHALHGSQSCNTSAHHKPDTRCYRRLSLVSCTTHSGRRDATCPASCCSSAASSAWLPWGRPR
jgi:hypothetical protein